MVQGHLTIQVTCFETTRTVLIFIEYLEYSDSFPSAVTRRRKRRPNLANNEVGGRGKEQHLLRLSSL